MPSTPWPYRHHIEASGPRRGTPSEIAGDPRDARRDGTGRSRATQELAGSLNNIGNELTNMGQLEQGLALYRRAADQQEKVCAYASRSEQWKISSGRADQLRHL